MGICFWILLMQIKANVEPVVSTGNHDGDSGDVEARRQALN